MKALFVNPYIYDFTAYDLWLRPLGLLYIAGVIQQYTGCDIYWLDALDRYQAGAGIETKGKNRGKFYREIVDKPPEYRCIPRYYARCGMPVDHFREKVENLPDDMDIILVTSLMTYWIDGVRFTLDILRERFPKAKIVLGGILPSLLPGTLLDHYLGDGSSRPGNQKITYVKGSGETEILEIIAAMGGQVYRQPAFTNLDDLPYPAANLITNHQVLPLMTSRGCPYRCTYCASQLLNGKFRERDAGRILEEIYFMVEQYGTREFVIFDDALLINRKQRFLKVFAEVAEKLKINFHTPNGMHPGEIDEETAGILFKCGFKTLRLSFESIKADILARSAHKVSIEKMVRAVENLEKAGYKRKELGVYLLFGIPGQEIEDVRQSIFFVRNLGVVPYLSHFSPVPGTVEFVKLQQAGILSSPVNLYETNKIYFLYEKTGFSREDIQQVKDLRSRLNIEISREG